VELFARAIQEIIKMAMARAMGMRVS